jgi:AcrR family transcriptional regulator
MLDPVMIAVMATVTHPPQQQRSRESLEKLMVAGLEVLEEDGWDGFTIAAVAKRAGVGGASVYRRFEDKEALLLALHERFGQELSSQSLPAFRSLARADLDLETLVRRLLEETANIYLRREGLMRFFVLHSRVDPRLAASGDREIRALSLEFEDALLAHRDQFGCADPELAVAVSFQSVLDSFLGLVLQSGRAHSELDWEVMTEQLSAMTLAYLRADPPKT